MVDSTQIATNMGREPKQSEVPNTLSIEKLQKTPKGNLLSMVETLTAGQSGHHNKLKYAEFSMTDALKKDYDALPASTKDHIGGFMSRTCWVELRRGVLVCYP